MTSALEKQTLKKRVPRVRIRRATRADVGRLRPGALELRDVKSVRGVAGPEPGTRDPRFERLSLEQIGIDRIGDSDTGKCGTFPFGAPLFSYGGRQTAPGVRTLNPESARAGRAARLRVLEAAPPGILFAPGLRAPAAMGIPQAARAARLCVAVNSSSSLARKGTTGVSTYGVTANLRFF